MSLPKLESYSVQVVGGIVRHEGRPYTAGQEFPAPLGPAIRHHVSSGCKIRRNGVELSPTEIGKLRAELAKATARRHANPAPPPRQDPFKPPLPLREGDQLPPLSATRAELLKFIRGYYGVRAAPMDDATFGELRYHLKDLFIIKGPSPWRTVPPPPGSPEAEEAIEIERTKKLPKKRVEVENWADELSEEEKRVLEGVVEKKAAVEEKAAEKVKAAAERSDRMAELLAGPSVEIDPERPLPPRRGAGSSKVAVLAWLSDYGVAMPADASHAEVWDLIDLRFVEPEPEPDSAVESPADSEPEPEPDGEDLDAGGDNEEDDDNDDG